MRGTILAVLALLMLAACGGGDRGLRQLDNPGGGPDEFSILPSRPLEMPETLATLPQPTPGGANRTDPNPLGDGIAALGGNQNAGRAGGIPAADAGLIGAVNRYGTDPAIRDTLAAEDEAFRRRRGRLSAFGMGRVDRYFAAYAGMALDAYAEFIRFRNLGVQVPSAPPAN